MTEEIMIMLIWAAIFSLSVLVCVLLTKGLIDTAGDRDLLVEQVLRELEERREKK